MAIVRIGCAHSIDHRSQDSDSGVIELSPGPFDLRKPADIETRRQNGPIGPLAQDEGVGDGEYRGRVDHDEVIELSKPRDQNSEIRTVEDEADVIDRVPGGEEMERPSLDGNSTLFNRQVPLEDIAQARAIGNVEE